MDNSYYIIAAILLFICVFYYWMLSYLQSECVFMITYRIYDTSWYNPWSLDSAIRAVLACPHAKFKLHKTNDTVIMDAYFASYSDFMHTRKYLKPIQKLYSGRVSFLIDDSSNYYFPNS